MANYIEKCPELVKGKRVLELGAGAALPSIVSASEGATMVTATDYPDIELIQNMANNIARNVKTSNINVTGFMWGSDAQCLLNASGNCAYDVIIMCDLVFNHSQHHNMLKTCAECLSDDGIILCTFTHHRPWLADRDLQLFEIASEYGFMVSDEGSYMVSN